MPLECRFRFSLSDTTVYLVQVIIYRIMYFHFSSRAVFGWGWRVPHVRSFKKNAVNHFCGISRSVYCMGSVKTTIGFVCAFLPHLYSALAVVGESRERQKKQRGINQCLAGSCAGALNEKSTWPGMDGVARRLSLHTENENSLDTKTLLPLKILFNFSSDPTLIPSAWSPKA